MGILDAPVVSPAVRYSAAALAYPETYGAVGNGSTDDTAALKLWLVSGGKRLGLSPNKTYLHQQELDIPSAVSVLDGNGATLKRAPQGVTTTATTIVSGVTNAITVASVSGGSGATAWALQVGDRIVVEQGGTFDASARTISNVAGSVVTITGTFGVSLSGTINVRHGYNQISPLAASQRITNLVVDGNSSNWSWGRWQHTCGIQGYGAAKRLHVDHCRIINQYGDGVTFSAAGCTLSFCDIENIKGRGFVFAGAGGNPTDIQNKVLHNRFVNCNADTAAGGSDGTATIDFSQGGPGAEIHGNTIDGGVDGIEIAAYNNSQVTVTNNELFNLSGIGIGPGTYGGSGSAHGVIVANNRLYSCGIEVRSGTTVRRWNIHDNLIYGFGANGSIYVSTADQIQVHNNQIYAGPIGPPTQIAATGQAGGSFSAQTLYYKITATNSVGESTASAEAVATVPANGYVTLTWNQVPGATGYKIYRATTTGAQNVSPAFVAAVAGTTTTTYTDIVATSAGAVPATDTTQPTSGSLITANTLTSSRISGNTICGGGNGMIGSGCTDLSLDGNTFIGCYLAGYTETDGAQATLIVNNTFIANANCSSSYFLLKMAGAESQARNNRFDLAGIATSATAIIITNNASNCVFEGNFVIGGSSINLMNASADKGVIRNNRFDHAVTITGANVLRSGNRYNSGAHAGSAVLAGGTVTVGSLSAITAPDTVRLLRTVAGGTLGNLSYTTVAATSLTITSDNASDTSTVQWLIDH